MTGLFKRLQAAKSSVVRPVRQSIRRRRISATPFFQAFPTDLDPIIVDARTMIDEEYKYAYFRIPKAANSYVVANLLRNQRTVDGELKQETVEAFKKSGAQTASSYFKSAKNFEFERDRLFKFTFVRDPYSRFLSAFRDKIVRHESPERQMVLKSLGAADDFDITQEQFAKFLEEGSALGSDAHWARQTDLLSMPIENFDFVGRVENAAEDMSQILQSIYSDPKPVNSFAPHATNAGDVLDSMDSSTKAIVRRLYAPDFEILGYPS